MELVANVPPPSKNAFVTTLTVEADGLAASDRYSAAFMANDLAVVVVPVKFTLPKDAPVTFPVPRAASAATCTVPFKTLVPPV